MLAIHWENGAGIARHGGVTIDLSKRPLMDGIESLHFDPTEARIKRVGEEERPLSMDEQRDYAKRVVQAASDAWDALEGQVTLAVVFGQ